MYSRRRFLATSSVLGTLLVGGCLGAAENLATETGNDDSSGSSGDDGLDLPASPELQWSEEVTRERSLLQEQKYRVRVTVEDFDGAESIRIKESDDPNSGTTIATISQPQEGSSVTVAGPGTSYGSADDLTYFQIYSVEDGSEEYHTVFPVGSQTLPEDDGDDGSSIDFGDDDTTTDSGDDSSRTVDDVFGDDPSSDAGDDPVDLPSTRQEITDARRSISEDRYIHWDFELNSKSTVSYSFTVVSGPDIDVFLVGRDELANFENSESFRAYSSASGSSGSDEVPLASGSYTLVLDNTDAGTVAPPTNLDDDVVNVDLEAHIED